MRDLVMVYPDKTVHNVTVTSVKRFINARTGKQEFIVYYVDNSYGGIETYASVVEISGEWYRKSVYMNEGLYYYLTDANYVVSQLPDKLNSFVIVGEENERIIEEKMWHQKYITEVLKRFECFSPVKFNDVISGLGSIDGQQYDACVSKIESLVERFRNVSLITYDRMSQLREELLDIINSYKKADSIEQVDSNENRIVGSDSELILSGKRR